MQALWILASNLKDFIQIEPPSGSALIAIYMYMEINDRKCLELDCMVQIGAHLSRIIV